MDTSSFEEMVGGLGSDLVDSGLHGELLEQRRLFEQEVWRDDVDPPVREAGSIVVGLINGVTYSAPTIRDLMRETVELRENSVLYFEVVNRASWEQSHGG